MLAHQEKKQRQAIIASKKDKILKKQEQNISQAKYNINYKYQKPKYNNKRITKSAPESSIEKHIKELKEKGNKREVDRQIALLFKKADSLLARQEESEAEKIFIQILAIDERHIGANSRLALLFLQRKEFSKSESLHRTLIELKPKDPAIHTNLGLTLFYQQKYDEAIDHFRRAIELNPSRGARYANLGKVFLAIGDYDSAKECFHEAVRLDLRNIEFLFLLAECEKELKKFSNAKEVFEHILKIEPFNEEAKKEFDSLKVLGF